MAKESLLEMDLSGRDKIILIACILAVIILALSFVTAS